MSTGMVLAHDLVVAMEAGEWDRANHLVLQAVPLNKQLDFMFLGREGDTLSTTMALGESGRGFSEGTVHEGMLATFADVVSANAIIGSHGH